VDCFGEQKALAQLATEREQLRSLALGFHAFSDNPDGELARDVDQAFYDDRALVAVSQPGR
jgi:hypothetical protein